MQLLGEKNMLSNYHEETHTSLHSNDPSVQTRLQNSLLGNGVDENEGKITGIYFLLTFVEQIFQVKAV